VNWQRPESCTRRGAPSSAARPPCDTIARLRLKKASARLVRRSSDHGRLRAARSMMPVRGLSTAFDGVALEGVGLDERGPGVGGSSPDPPPMRLRSARSDA